MTPRPSEVPAWLLNDLNLIAGVFNETRTAVIGRPNGHLRPVLDTGNGPPTEVTPRLNEEQQRRLQTTAGSANG